MLKVAFTGSTGLVGSRVQELLYHDIEFIPLLQSEVDITDKKSVDEFLKKVEYDILLHMAAYTNVDGAEKERALAHKINVEGTKNLFAAVSNVGKKFIYISTDFVFDGKNPPFDEDSIPNPAGYYGQTKYEGELAVAGQAMIIRLSYPYRKYFEKKPDFVWRIKELLESGKSLKMVTDSAMTPTHIDDIALGLKHLMENFDTSVYHLCGRQDYSPFAVTKLIAKYFGLDEKLIEETSFEEFSKGRAPRPRYSVLTSKRNHFQPMKTFEEGLELLTKKNR